MWKHKKYYTFQKEETRTLYGISYHKGSMASIFLRTNYKELYYYYKNGVGLFL